MVNKEEGTGLASPAGRDGLTRRQFLARAWWGAAGLLLLMGGWVTWKLLEPRVNPGVYGGQFRVPLSALPKVGEIDTTYVNTGRFYLSRVPLSRGSSGLLALYRRCTQRPCVVVWMAGGPSHDKLAPQGRFQCPCCGGVYDRYGVVYAGPPPRPLDLFPITVKLGEVVVHTKRVIQRSGYEERQAIPV